MDALTTVHRCEHVEHQSLRSLQDDEYEVLEGQPVAASWGVERSPAPRSRFSEGARSALGRALLAPYTTRKVLAASEEVANQSYRGKPAEVWKSAKPRA